MLRAILAVILGYIVMFVIIAVSFTSVQFSLGTDRILKPGLYEVTTLFILFAVALSFIAAILGGYIAALVARSTRPAVILAALVLTLGFISAAIQINRPDPGPRAPDVSARQAAAEARQPAWYAFTIPLIGAAGILSGAQLRRSRAQRPPH